MYTSISHAAERRRAGWGKVVILGIIGAMVGGVWWWNTQKKGETDTHFVASSRAYVAAASVHQRAVLTPGAGENPVRQRLDAALVTVLSDTTLDAATRLTWAHQGVGLVGQLQVQIDDVAMAAADVQRAIARLKADAARIPPGDVHRHATALVTAITEKVRVIGRIESISYSFSGSALGIFNQVIYDSGILTDVHVVALNERIPELEQQFVERTRLYQELERVEGDIQALFAQMVENQ